MERKNALLLLVCLLFLASICTVNAEGSFQMQWSKTFSGWSGYAISTSDGGYAIVGSNASLTMYPSSQIAPVLVKTNSLGEMEWRKTFELSGLVGVRSVAQTVDGGFVMACVIYSSSQSNSNVILKTGVTIESYILKTGSDGSIQWNKTLAIDGPCVIQDSDGNFIVTGSKQNNFNGDDSFLIKLDETGSIVWSKTFGEDSSKIFFTNLIETSDHNYAIAGSRDNEGLLVKADSDGNTQLWKTIHVNELSTVPLLDIYETVDTGFIFAGGNINHGLVLKTDSTGNINWYQLYEPAIFHSVTEISNAYIAVGAQNNQSYIVKLDNVGNKIADCHYGETTDGQSSALKSITPSSNNSFVVSGTLNVRFLTNPQANGSSGNYLWLAKFTTTQDDSVTNITNTDSAFPIEYAALIAIPVIAVIAGLIIYQRKHSSRAKP